MKPITITLRTLDRLGACEAHRGLFARTFPFGAVLNETNITRALGARLDVHWFIASSPRLNVKGFICGQLTQAQYRCYHNQERGTYAVRRAVARKLMKALSS